MDPSPPTSCRSSCVDGGGSLPPEGGEVEVGGHRAEGRSEGHLAVLPEAAAVGVQRSAAGGALEDAEEPFDSVPSGEAVLPGAAAVVVALVGAELVPGNADGGAVAAEALVAVAAVAVGCFEAEADVAVGAAELVGVAGSFGGGAPPSCPSFVIVGVGGAWQVAEPLWEAEAVGVSVDDEGAEAADDAVVAFLVAGVESEDRVAAAGPDGEGPVDRCGLGVAGIREDVAEGRAGVVGDVVEEGSGAACRVRGCGCGGEGDGEDGEVVVALFVLGEDGDVVCVAEPVVVSGPVRAGGTPVEVPASPSCPASAGGAVVTVGERGRVGVGAAVVVLVGAARPRVGVDDGGVDGEVASPCASNVACNGAPEELGAQPLQLVDRVDATGVVGVAGGVDGAADQVPRIRDLPVGERRPVALVCAESFPVRGAELPGELRGVFDVERLVVSCCSEEHGEHAADGPVAGPAEPFGPAALFEAFDRSRGAVEDLGDLGDVFVVEHEVRHRGDRPVRVAVCHVVRLGSWST